MFLIIIILVGVINSQLLKHVSNCLGSCMTCSIFQPSQCSQIQGYSPCQNGYSFNQQSNRCQLKKVFQSNFTSFQFTQDNSLTNYNKKSTDWKQGKVTQCSYTTQKGVQKYINVIGLFKQVQSISKQFFVSQHHEYFYFSFSLVKSSWMPKNDFLIVDFQAGTKLLGSYQISYDNRQQLTDSNIIICNQQAVVSQKYTIKIHQGSFKTNKIKVTFTGFLFTSVWGISNIKLIPGCEKFTVYNRLTENCDFCNLGYFPIYKNNQLERCSKCPFQCTKCLNNTYCTACIRGYRMFQNSLCIPNDDFSRLEIKQYVNSQYKNCRQMNISFYTNSQNNIIQTIPYKNPSKAPFGDVRIVFELIYNSKFQFKNGTIDVALNGQKISQINQINLTNQGFEACSIQSLDRYSVLKFTLSAMNVSNDIKLTFKSSECVDCKFGLSNLKIVYVDNTNRDIIGLLHIQTFDSYKDAKVNILNSQQLKIDHLQTQLIKPKDASYILNNITHQQPMKMNNTNDSTTYNQSFIASSSLRIQQKNQTFASYHNNTATVKDYNSTNDNIMDTGKESVSDSKNINIDAKNNTVIRISANEKTKNESNFHQNNSIINSTTQLKPLPFGNNDSFDKKFLEQKNDSKIDHISFSKNGNNGIIIKLNQKYFSNLSKYQTLIMELTQTSPHHKNHQSQRSHLNLQNSLIVHSQSSSSLNSIQPKLLVSQSNPFSKLKSFTFYTDKTYIDDKITLYALSSNSTKTQITSFNIYRTDYVQNDSQRVLDAFQNIFITFAWITLTILFLAIMSGKYFLVQESIQSIQFLFLGIYVFTSYLPASILNTISGLRRLENLDFLVNDHLNSIEKLLLGDLVMDGPLRFTLFNQDINFIRGLIPLIFLASLLGLWYLIIYLFDKKMNRKQEVQQNQDVNAYASYHSPSNNQFSFIRTFNSFICQDLIHKKTNYYLQIIKLFFLPTIFLCFKQFNNFSYPEGHSGQIVNMLFCLITFFGFFAGTIFLIIYCSNQYFKQQYEIFTSNLQALYYKKIPKNYLPTLHHRLVNPLFRYFKVFLFTLLVAFLGNYPLLVSIIMILFYGGQLFYAWFEQIYQDSLHFKFLFLESVLMGILHVLVIIISQISGIASTQGYLSIGYVYMSISIVIILNSLARIAYLMFNYIQKIKIKNQRNKRASLRQQIIV